MTVRVGLVLVAVLSLASCGSDLREMEERNEQLCRSFTSELLRFRDELRYVAKRHKDESLFDLVGFGGHQLLTDFCVPGERDWSMVQWGRVRAFLIGGEFSSSLAALDAIIEKLEERR